MVVDAVSRLMEGANGMAEFWNGLAGRRLSCIDMHTAGEPVRIVTAGIGLPEGGVLAMREFLGREADWMRRALMLEPRGHDGMYGAVLVPSGDNTAAFGAVFMHNEGYSTMCGHAVIALGRYAVDSGLASSGDNFVIECPCGPVDVAVAPDGTVSFTSVPAFVVARDVPVRIDGFAPFRADIAYGGAYYAILPLERLGVAWGGLPPDELARVGERITRALAAAVSLPGPAALAFLYGTIFTDGTEDAAQVSENICIFAGRQIDRSPTGSGVTARMALRAAGGRARLGEIHRFRSITGGMFTAGLATAPAADGSVRVIVSGRAHYMARAEFLIEDGDDIGRGFLISESGNNG